MARAKATLILTNMHSILYRVQDKKRIARKKEEARKAALREQGIDIHESANMLDEEDGDLLF